MILRKIHNIIHPVAGRILMLHRVVEHRSDDPAQRELEVTPGFLEQTILEYRQMGYSFISISEVLRRMECWGKYSVNPLLRRKRGRFVCITFDDGYQDNYDIAYPILRRLEVSFTVYVTTGFIDNCLPMWWYPGERLGIDTKSLKALDADPLCTIGAHTMSHPRLDTLSREEQYKEIAGSKQMLESLLSHEVKHFSFPHGAYNDDTIAISRELGFQTLVQSWGGPLRCGKTTNPLPRLNIIENNNNGTDCSTHPML